MNIQSLLLLCAMGAPLALLSTGCRATGQQGANGNLVVPRTRTSPYKERTEDDDWYEPPRSPQYGPWD